MTEATQPSRVSPTARLSLSEDLTIYHAAAQKEELLEALANCERLELDLSTVGDIDTAGIQLLILVKREAQLKDKQVVITGHSISVQQAIDFCNLAAAFGDPMLIPA